MKIILLIVIFFTLPLILTANETQVSDSSQTQFAPYLRPDYRVSVEYNPGLALWGAGEHKATIISAGFSWFPANSDVEITIPVLIQHTNKNELYDPEEYIGSTITVDVRYRKYLMGKVGGIYNSLGLTYQYLDLTYDSDDTGPAFYDIQHFVANKIGVGAGAGYRIFSDANFNWTIGIFLGRYIYMDRSNESLLGAPIFEFESSGILRVQILKFGFAW